MYPMYMYILSSLKNQTYLLLLVTSHLLLTTILNSTAKLYSFVGVAALFLQKSI